MKTTLTFILATLLALVTEAHTASTDTVTAPVFIIIGQSNADGSAMFDPDEDARLRAWYTSPANTGGMKIWYRSTQVQNQPANALGEAARWVVDGTVTDHAPGWMNLWYRNENDSSRTAMNMIHSFGTYSTGTDTNCARGRRGILGELGMKYREALPDKELYIIKLGVSGSFISSWADTSDNTNWNYFFDRMYHPAIESLLSQGKRPYLTGIWWMQGCADSGKTRSYYESMLRRLVDKCRTTLGFPDGKFYVGHIVKPGESTVTPQGSVAYSDAVRQAQDTVAASTDGVEIVDTRDCELQYEPNFNGYIHFSHKGINTLADILANKITSDPHWTPYTTPGTWIDREGTAEFFPAIGTPQISYIRSTDRSHTLAILTYPGWSEFKIHTTPGTEPRQ